MTPDIEAAQVLERTAELIAKDGWTRGPFRPYGRRCLSVAIRDAQGHLRRTEVTERVTRAVADVAEEDYTVVQQWKQFCVEGNYPTCARLSIMFVNDYCLTSGEDAILLAKEAARRLGANDG